ncbi:hypothetical protein [Nakamurella lactea]|uniref:hypothetical protein n=1 Tax=Nakamurella lactea TaxID=459515 RepID=UPI00042393AF|nr:hypothetical protein [Nakamurella lactea]
MTTLLAGSSVAGAAPRTMAAAGMALRRLARIDRAAGQRAAAAIAGALGPVDGSAWPELADRFSRLTNTGLGLEFAWSSKDAAVRWIAECGPPEMAERDRLVIAARAAFGSEIADRPSMPRTPPTGVPALQRLLDRTAALQHDMPLRFGAWTAGRHRSNSPDSRKVYAELTGLRVPAAVRGLGLTPPSGRLHPVLHSHGLVCRMVGLNDDGTIELYTRTTDPDEPLIRGLEKSITGRDAVLWAAVTELAGTTRLPRPSGVSMVLDERAEPLAVCWFSFAKALFPDDAATLAALRRAPAAPGSVAVLNALAAGEPDGRWRFGIVGVGVSRDGKLWSQAGIRPT